MPEANEDKSEDPTPKRRREFREEGKIAQSRDVGGVLILAGVIGVVATRGASLHGLLERMYVRSFDLIAAVPQSDPTRLMAALGEALRAFAIVGGTIGGLVFVLGTGAGLLQTGGNFSWKVFGKGLEKLNPISGLKRLFASWETLQQVGLAIAKAAFLGIALYVVLRGAVPQLTQLPRLDPAAALSSVGMLLLRVALVGLLGATIFAAIDYWFSFRKVNEELKMTKQEVKDELKQQEGDPMVKGRLRQRMRQIGTNRMLADTSEADVIVVNPTHYAVALAYQPGRDVAPRLLSKGKDHVAAKIREIARKNNIPIVANPPVARAIHASAEVGREIPADLYDMVARVLAYLYKMKGRTSA